MTVYIGTDSQLISLVIVVVNKKKKVFALLSIGLVTTKGKRNRKGSRLCIRRNNNIQPLDCYIDTSGREVYDLVEV